jgi:rhamnosyl/mannosyltransferase
MSRLRVLHLGKFYAPEKGGMETALQTMCRGEQRVVETHALVVNRARETTHDVVEGVPVTRVANWLTIGAVAIAPALPFHLARAQADVVVLHEPNPMALVAWFVVRPRAPLVIWYHSEVVRPGWRYRLFYRPFLESALRRAARIVVASPPMQNVPALAAYRTKCVVIPYGLDRDRFLPTSVVRARADALREGARRPLLLFVGRLVPYKGLDVLLRALPGLEARTVIVGDGRLRRSLEATVRELGLSDRVELTGTVTDDERLAWLHACDALVLPSTTRQEAFGMVQLEAMLCGRPVVSTDLPTGVPWVNVDGETGLIVRTGDVASLRGALDRLVADPDLRQELGAGARARAESIFTADRMCTASLAQYEVVSASRP